MKHLVRIIILFAISNCNAQVKDIDNNEYETVKIGNQEWLLTNLNTERFQNGDTIFQAKTKGEWAKAGKNKQAAWCYYEFNASYGAQFGKLYNFYAANDERGLAPKGYHVPTKKEYKTLLAYTGDSETKGDRTGDRLKSTSGWELSDLNGNNKTGFSAIPNGRINTMPYFWFNEQHCNFWTSNSFGFDQAYALNMFHSCFGASTLIRHYQKRSEGFPIRCIKN
jgi:uncharacterized protein (TIGR02145 family)